MTILDGQTDAPAYVFNLNSVDPTTGENPDYNIIPLLSVGDEVPYLEGEWGNVTPSETLTYAMAGIPDGLGISKIGDFYYVWMNHEIASPLTSEISSTVEGTINGSRVSLYLFDQDWKAIGGKNLIETATADGTVYTWNLETGNYESENGEILNTNDHENFTRFCSGYLAASGFVDENGNVPIYFAPEETTENAALGQFARSRGWAVTPDGNALALDGLGIYAKEQVFAASQYRADNSDYTVLFSSEDYTNGELYLYVGKQTEVNPNGFTNNPENFDLYVLRVEDEQGNIFSYETMPENASLVAKWTLVPDQAALGSQERLSQWVDAQNRSTNFRRLEDLHEDPNNLGTFYFVTTGTDDVVPGTEERDNPFGKLHRFTFALDENGQPQEGAFEFLLEGGQNTGVSYDNITVDQSGNVLIQEDRTGAGGDIMDEQQRNGRVLSYNISYNEEQVGNDEITFLFELDQTVEGEEFDTGFGNWETSGIVEVPNSLGSYLFDVQAHSIKDSRYVEGGQLILVTPKESGAIVELVGFASQPADTFADGPSSGNFIDTVNRPTPFTSQPVQGFSGVQFANDGNYWFLSDNGFGSKSNSADFLLRIYQIDPDFKTATEGTGETEWTDFIQLSDPNNLVPFDIVNESTSDRLLTGADFDVESLVIADDDTFWIGDEFGPYLLHFDANGVLLDAPIATPNITNLNTLEGQVPLVIGHRGASGELPEHTLESYKRAIEQGADFIEPDLVSTKDGVLIARHEPILAQVELDENGAIKLDAQGKPIVISATTNIADKTEFANRVTVKMLDGNLIGGWFADDFTLEEIKTLQARQIRSFRPQEFNDLYEIPTLDEVIDLVQQVETETGKKIGIYPETKHPTYFDNLGLSLEENLVGTLLDQGFTDPARIFIQSFEVANLLDLKNNLLAGTELENTPLVQLYDVFNGQPYDIVANFSDPNFDSTSVYGTNLITATTNYGDLINQDEDNSQNLLSFVAEYASGIGPWKRTFVLTAPLATPVDGNGDGVAEITEQLTGEILPIVEDAHAAGLQVHPYTFRDEERFLVLKPNGTPQTAEEEYQQFIQLGVDGFFTDFPATGDKVRDQITGDFVRSLSNPDVLAGNAVANLPNSRGFEGMAYSRDRQTLYPLLEGSVIGDPTNALRIYEFDVATQTFADELVGYYGLEKTGNAIGDFTPINDTEFLVIERDNEQGVNAQFKKIFKIDISKTDENGYVEKEELVNLLNIADPNDLNGDGSQLFTFPFQTIENLIVLDETTLLVANDNNYPFSIGRGPNIDNTEFITLKLSEPLDLDPLLGIPDPEPMEPPTTVYGSPNDDSFDSVFPDEKGFIGFQQILFTGSGNDTVDVSLAFGNNRIDLGSGNDTLYAGGNNRILAGSGDDLLFVGSGDGNNVITGGTGQDQFWLVTDVQDLPTQSNIITDFMAASDVIGLANTNLDFAALTLTQNGANTIINALDQDLAVLQNVQVTSLNATNFVFA